MQCQVVESNAQSIEHLNSWQSFNKLSTSPTLLSCLLLMMTRLLISVVIFSLHLLPAWPSSTVDVVFPKPAEFPDTKTLPNSSDNTTVAVSCSLVPGVLAWPVTVPTLCLEGDLYDYTRLISFSKAYWLKISINLKWNDIKSHRESPLAVCA